MKIEFDKHCNPNCVYEISLSMGVTEITKRIGRTFHEVTWVVFNNNNPPDEWYNNRIEQQLHESSHRSTLSPFFVPKVGKDYGFCLPQYKKVYISCMTIQSYSPIRLRANTNPLSVLQQRNENSLSRFADVVTDELAHIATGRDHGDLKYEHTLAEYRSLCKGL